MATILEVVGIVFGVLVFLCCCGVLVRLLQIRRRRRRLQGGAGGLDGEERRFQRRLEQQMQEIDTIFENEDEEHALDSDDIENLQLLEAELSLKGEFLLRSLLALLA